MRTFAVIGSNCFTGSHVVDALLEAYPDARVHAVSRSPEKGALYLPYKARAGAAERVSFHQIDLAKEPARLLALLDEARPQVVVNVAALSEVNLSNFEPLGYFQTNTVGVVALASELRKRDWLERYVHISSAEIYGSCREAIKESTPLNPSTPYAVSKAAADMYLLTLHKNFGFPVTLVRSTNVCGKHQQLFKIIPRTAIYLKQGKKIQLQGGGTAQKSFVHIRDVVRGILRILETGASAPIYHFSTDDDRTVADVVALVCRAMGRDPEASTVVVGDRVGQDARYRLDWSAAQRELDWAPAIGLEETAREMIDWVERSWDAIRMEPLEYVHKV